MECKLLGIPFIHISTDYVFAGTGKRPWATTDIPNPQNAYGRSKLKGEEAIKASGGVYVILRTSWVVSAHGNNFVKTMLRLSKKCDGLSVVDDQIGGPTCARDVAKTCISIAYQLIKDSKKSGIFHYCGEPAISWCGFANEIFTQIGCKTIAIPIATLDYPTPAVRPSNSRLNCVSTREIFGLSQPSWREGLTEILTELEYRHGKS